MIIAKRLHLRKNLHKTNNTLRTAVKRAVPSFYKTSSFESFLIRLRIISASIGIFALILLTGNFLYRSTLDFQILAEEEVLGVATQTTIPESKNSGIIIPKPDEDEISLVQEKYTQRLIQEEEERIKKEAEERRIQQLLAQATELRRYLESQNAPIATYAETIILSADQCGGDYRLLTAIAMNESGGGRIPYKSYNPYGYLNGIQYSGWDEAITEITCKISNQYLKNGLNTPELLAGPYGAKNQEKWISNIYYYLNQIP